MHGGPGGGLLLGPTEPEGPRRQGRGEKNTPVLGVLSHAQNGVLLYF